MVPVRLSDLFRPLPHNRHLRWGQAGESQNDRITSANKGIDSNICRSPMGEAVLKDIANKRGVDIVVDSCGTASYHAGETPDERTVAVCRKNDVPIDSFARQISTSDFIHFTHILAADDNNLRQLNRIKPSNATAEVRLWGSYADNKPIPDPYYGGISDFEKVFQQCTRLSNAFLDEATSK